MHDDFIYKDARVRSEREFDKAPQCLASKTDVESDSKQNQEPVEDKKPVLV
jgi:hypothetical protein